VHLVVPKNEYAKMAKGVGYTLHPVNAVAGYQWKVKDGLAITREASLEEKLDSLQRRVDKLEQRLKELEKQKATNRRRGDGTRRDNQSKTESGNAGQ
jgi:TolA-binding protein